MVDCFVLKIGNEHLPKNFKNKIVEFNEDETVIRSNLKDMDDINQWVKDFGELTHTQWNSRNSRPSGQKFICWKKFVCHCSSFMKVPVSSKRSKCSNCKASLLLRIKLNNKNTRYVDPYVQLGQCAVIVVKNKHSHSLLADEILSSLSSNEQTKDKFIEYFEKGMGVAESCHYHERVLEMQDCTQVELSSGRINPTERRVRQWYDQWKKSNFIPKDGVIKGDIQLYSSAEDVYVSPDAYPVTAFEFDHNVPSPYEAEEYSSAASVDDPYPVTAFEFDKNVPPSLYQVFKLSGKTESSSASLYGRHSSNVFEKDYYTHSDDMNEDSSDKAESLEKILDLLKSCDSKFGSSSTGLERFKKRLEKIHSPKQWEIFLHTAGSQVHFRRRNAAILAKSNKDIKRSKMTESGAPVVGESDSEKPKSARTYHPVVICFK